MIHFVNPSILPSFDDFKNRYIKTIERGQKHDSSPQDARIARRRAWLLHQRVNSLILRRDISTLKEFLPKRHELVIVVKLTDVQRRMYRLFLELIEKQVLFWTYDCMSMLSNHPDVFREYLKNKDHELEKEEKRAINRSLREQQQDPDYHPPEIEYTEGNEVAENAKISSAGTDGDDDCLEGTNDETLGRNHASDENDENGDVEEIRRKRKEIESLQALFDVSVTGYSENILESSNKMLVLLRIIHECRRIGDRLVVFSRSLSTLDFIEQILNSHNREHPGKEEAIEYVRFDGSTRQERRQELIDRFNDTSNTLNLFLISTLAGGEGINLHGANRVVLFDTNWNPSNDSEACCRVYRLNQKKEVYIYRIITHETIEEKVHAKQLKKEVLSAWVIDNRPTTLVANVTDRSLLLAPAEKPHWETQTSQTTEQSKVSDHGTPMPYISERVTDQVARSIFNCTPEVLVSIKDQQYLILDDPTLELTEDDKIIAVGEEEFESVYNAGRRKRSRISQQGMSASSSSPVTSSSPISTKSTRRSVVRNSDDGESVSEMILHHGELSSSLDAVITHIMDNDSHCSGSEDSDESEVLAIDNVNDSSLESARLRLRAVAAPGTSDSVSLSHSRHTMAGSGLITPRANTDGLDERYVTDFIRAEPNSRRMIPIDISADGLGASSRIKQYPSIAPEMSSSTPSASDTSLLAREKERMKKQLSQKFLSKKKKSEQHSQILTFSSEVNYKHRGMLDTPEPPSNPGRIPSDSRVNHNSKSREYRPRKYRNFKQQAHRWQHCHHNHAQQYDGYGSRKRGRSTEDGNDQRSQQVQSHSRRRNVHGYRRSFRDYNHPSGWKKQRHDSAQ